MTDLPPPDDATRAQIAAADPAGSVWLAANAGSGKTRVLTDRVAWLLLEGTAPERILCLTYTKAAAGEMQLRLFQRLSAWAMLPDDDLRRAITTLGARRGTIPTETLRRARTLFARAVETPGGLKIQTIHAFCAGLLRRFPLEAGVSPAFAEMDETATARLHAEVLDAMALEPATRPLVDAVATRLSDGEPSAFLAAVAGHREGLARPADEAHLRAVLGVGRDDAGAIRARVAGDGVLPLLETLLPAVAAERAKTMQALAPTLAAAIAAAPDARFDLLRQALLTRDLEPRRAPVTKGVTEAIGPDARDALDTLASELAEAHARIAALAALDRSLALHAFGPAFAARVETAKRARGWLDFDDLIARANHLLSTAAMAQWVLYRLDGGLDHILVDEAQDTSPGQWRLVQRLSAEFGAGLGARADVARTIFVVGDRKQSIYGFQGADLDAYTGMRDTFAAMLPPGGPVLRDHSLLHSFRSAPAILDLVDATFAGGGGVGEPPRHVAFHPRMPGRVDLWPVVEAEAEDRSDRDWHDPVDRPARNDPNVVLADRVADAIHAMIEARVPVGRGEDRRPVRPGDILILLQRRRALFHHVVHACKARGLDLAGADRLALTSDLAVRDLIAALSWAAVPADDLSLAAVLRSPLCAVSEAGLFALARGRGRETLWHRLERSGADPAGAAMLGDLLSIADVLRPYEMLQRILIRHDGRRRLLARLGAEAAEAIDALLGQALAYERLETPSLAGFLGWLGTTDVDVRRQAGAGSIRVMSVHGAKGLEAPVVILPETMVRRERVPSGVRRLPDGTVVWLPPSAGHSPATRALVEATKAADAAERDRLLYVAMTRAESWLIVGAAGDVGGAPEASWYGRVRAGMAARGAAPHAFPWGEGLRLEQGDWSPAGARAPARAAVGPAPGWLETPVAPPPQVPPRIVPSALPGAKALPGEGAMDAATATRRGTALHALLEHLPRLPRAAWDARAPAILARHAALAGDDPYPVLAEARAVLDDPALGFLFAPGTLAEAPFALSATAARPAVFGAMDRVVVTADRVLVVDFKSNAVIPSEPAGTPEGLLAQMAAYRMAAAGIWPGRRVEAAILWTRAPRLMALPDDLLARHEGAIDALAARP